MHCTVYSLCFNGQKCPNEISTNSLYRQTCIGCNFANYIHYVFLWPSTYKRNVHIGFFMSSTRVAINQLRILFIFDNIKWISIAPRRQIVPYPNQICIFHCRVFFFQEARMVFQMGYLFKKKHNRNPKMTCRRVKIPQQSRIWNAQSLLPLWSWMFFRMTSIYIITT